MEMSQGVASLIASSVARHPEKAAIIERDRPYSYGYLEQAASKLAALFDSYGLAGERDLIEAGARLDGELLRATTTLHPSGLKVIAAPKSLMPLDAVSSEQLIEIVEIAKREFGTVFVDLPASWTNWSLSLLAQSDLVLLITELSVSGLHRARRQLDLLREQDLASLDLRLIVNRFEKGLLKTVKPGDVQTALGRNVSYTIANEPGVMQPAIERGVPISEIKRKSAVGRDIDMLDGGIAAALGRER